MDRIVKSETTFLLTTSYLFQLASFGLYKSYLGQHISPGASQNRARTIFLPHLQNRRSFIYQTTLSFYTDRFPTSLYWIEENFIAVCFLLLKCYPSSVDFVEYRLRINLPEYWFGFAGFPEDFPLFEMSRVDSFLMFMAVFLLGLACSALGEFLTQKIVPSYWFFYKILSFLCWWSYRNHRKIM